MAVRIIHGDCLVELPKLAAAGERFHACVCDPPYELGFMGKRWDSTGVAFRPETWRAVYDCLLPGAYLLAFGGTRTSHRMACAIEDAGFEIRDSISYLYDGGLSGPLLWCFGSGFPKSLNVSKQLGHIRCLCEAGAPPNHRPTQDVSNLRQRVVRGDAVSGCAEQDMLANMQRRVDFQADEGEAPQGRP